MNTKRTPLVLAAIYALLFALCIFLYRPPATDAPLARSLQAQISPGPSRVVGSEANEHAREILKGQLEASGFVTEIQSTLSCGRFGACAFVKNLIATKTGADPEAGAVLLMAHLDSVPCSPGAGDDGFGAAAIVDAAHTLAAGPPLRRTLIVLLTDAEETGLLGAEAFLRQHPLARRVHGVVNVDSRGSGGPSAMFETTPGNAWLVDLFASSASRPVTSSLFYEVYRRMPNDTDFTVMRGSAQGVNLANVANVERYHTALDDVAHADPRTLAQHTAQALAMTRALANAGPELETRTGKDAVWFDVLALFVVRWPASWSLPLAVAAFALVLGWTIRRRAFSLRGLLAPVAALFAAAVMALILGALLQLFGALPVSWIAHPVPALLSLHCACFSAGLVIASLVAGTTTTRHGIWLSWSLIGIAVAAFVPGACFLFVVPALVAGLTGGLREDVHAIAPSVAAAIVWLPLVLLIYDGLGLKVPLLAALPSIVLASTWPPLTSPRVLVAPAAVALLAFVIAALVPPFSADVPERVNVVYRQNARGARVYIATNWGSSSTGDPPPAMLRALGNPSVHAAPFPAWPAAPGNDVPSLRELEQPSIDAPRQQGSQPLYVYSRRGARTWVLVTDATAATVEDQPATLRGGMLIVYNAPRMGLRVTLFGARRLMVLDVTSGIPEASPVAAAVRDARPANAVASQDGDLTVVECVVME